MAIAARPSLTPKRRAGPARALSGVQTRKPVTVPGFLLSHNV